MDIKRLLAFSLVLIAVLTFTQPVNALLWPPVIGTCGFGGIFGPFGLNGPLGFGFCYPAPVPVPVPVAVPVPAAIPGPLCVPGPGCGFCPC